MSWSKFNEKLHAKYSEVENTLTYDACKDAMCQVFPDFTFDDSGSYNYNYIDVGKSSCAICLSRYTDGYKQKSRAVVFIGNLQDGGYKYCFYDTNSLIRMLNEVKTEAKKRNAKAAKLNKKEGFKTLKVVGLMNRYAKDGGFDNLVITHETGYKRGFLRFTNKADIFRYDIDLTGKNKVYLSDDKNIKDIINYIGALSNVPKRKRLEPFTTKGNFEVWMQ